MESESLQPTPVDGRLPSGSAWVQKLNGKARQLRLERMGHRMLSLFTSSVVGTAATCRRKYNTLILTLSTYVLFSIVVFCIIMLNIVYGGKV